MVSINSRLDHAYGTVGMVLPGMEYKLGVVPGIDARGGRVGRLLVRGRNVMKGYLKDEKANRKYLVEDGGWYDTGDVVEITEEGFLKIVGRVKRFAKVGGEMVSLAAVEDALADAFGDHRKVDSGDRAAGRASGGEARGGHGQPRHRRKGGAGGAARERFFRLRDPAGSALHEGDAEAGDGQDRLRGFERDGGGVRRRVRFRAGDAASLWLKL